MKWVSMFFEILILIIAIVDAVYATAMAINNLIRDVCGLISYQLCDALKKESVGPELLKHIRKLSFKGTYTYTYRMTINLKIDSIWNNTCFKIRWFFDGS